MKRDANLLQTKEDLASLNGQDVVAFGRYCAIPRPIKGIVRKEILESEVALHFQLTQVCQLQTVLD
jgi:hypothetical protein